jgi:conjugal transfer pilus assembly protein TraB
MMSEDGRMPAPLRELLQRLSPRQRQWGMLLVIVAGGMSLLWLVFTFSEAGPKSSLPRPAHASSSPVTNIGVMSPGQQVNPVDQWVGTAGSKLAQYESEREEQDRLNKARLTFEAQTMKRFADLEQRLTSTTPAAHVPTAMPPAAALPLPAPPAAAPLPPLPPLPARTSSPSGLMPPGTPGPLAPLPPLAPSGPMVQPGPAVQVLTRVAVSDRSATAPTSPTGTPPPAGAQGHAAAAQTISTFLPVSFTRGVLLGGLDAPTGGQAQSNPHPILIRLSDNSILPNRFRGEYRECFVIAAGYGDISSERAYLRTESLSCVRADGAAMEIKIQGSVYGEDGKVGMRGRLVTKQGQLLANALLAGVVGGIGQGIASSSTTYSTSALGTIASATGSEALKAGVGSGVGRALDRLAQYYIKLAENTFPVIEVDAGREIDVVITKGVRIDAPPAAAAPGGSAARPTSPSGTDGPYGPYGATPERNHLEGSDDDTY